MNCELKILSRTKYIWQALLYIESLLYGLGVWLFLSGLTSPVITISAGSLTTLIILLLFKPWKIDLEYVALLVDRKFPQIENSASLLLSVPEDLSLIAQIQRKKLLGVLDKLGFIWPPNHLLRGTAYLLLLTLSGWVVQQILPSDDISIPEYQQTTEATNQIVAVDSLEQFPEINKVVLTIVPPAYTGLKTIKSKNLNAKAVKQSQLYWILEANDQVSDIYLEVSGSENQKLHLHQGKFTIALRLKENGFYNFKVVGHNGKERTTDLYRLEAIEDQPPEIALTGIDKYTTLDYVDNKKVSFRASLADDFGLSDAYITATVSKGSGESVKFREEQLTFDHALSKGAKSASLSKTINLDSMKMTPGDELYFYVEALDNRVPSQQRTRTETYFLSIRDTTDIEFSLAGSLGVDLMPEYFRSQRQIIIDTEKLIKGKRKIDTHDFNYKSNELGFDQKTLRLKYGQFMGEESESGIAIETEETVGNPEEGDPLTNYTHDHDNDNEHNLVDTEHKEDEEDPLHQYKHNHDDPEEATLYTASIKGMLKQAMAEMWDAELYLRLYQPEKSLPYQYKALKLIKQIKNHARIYVHRIGFDPPPLKEDKRLSGDLKEVKTKTQVVDKQPEDPFGSIKVAVATIDALLMEKPIYLSESDLLVFGEAGTALASFAVEEPVKYLKTLEWLKKLAGNEIEDKPQLRKVLKYVNANLIAAIPDKNNDPVPTALVSDSLTRNYLIHLNMVLDE